MTALAERMVRNGVSNNATKFLVSNGTKEDCNMFSTVVAKYPDSILMGYTKAQIEWCEAGEFSIWQFFIQENLLYTNKHEQLLSIKSGSFFWTHAKRVSRKGGCLDWLADCESIYGSSF